MFELRRYQHEAVEATYGYLRERPGNPLVVLPVGSGKSVVIGRIAADAATRWNGRVAVITHSAELVEQNADKLRRSIPHVDIGVFCAGLRSKNVNAPVVCASIQSIYRRAEELGPVDLVIIDEVHGVPPEGEGRYQTFLHQAQVINPGLRLIGLTATPYRLTSGLLYGPGRLFQDVCYEAGIRELIRDGYLSPLVAKAGASRADLSGVCVRGGEFAPQELEAAMDDDNLVEAACREIVTSTADREACLIFAAGVKHGRHVARVLKERFGVECGFVSADTPHSERAELLARFRGEPTTELLPRKPLKYLANCAVLTTGVDIPRLDAVALLRATMSPGLLVQMIGRGARLHPGKRNCLVLDYGGNLLRHGPIDQIRTPNQNSSDQPSGPAPAKECPQCHSVIAAGYANCPDCGHTFSPPERQVHESKASDAGVLSGQATLTKHRVSDVYYTVHTKRDAREGDPQTMRVDYKIGWHEYKSEWVCFEHTGFARQKAIAWWKRRSPDPVPDSAERAVELAQSGALAPTLTITVRSVAGEPYDRITDYELGAMPEPVPAEVLEFYEEARDEIPF